MTITKLVKFPDFLDHFFRFPNFSSFCRYSLTCNNPDKIILGLQQKNLYIFKMITFKQVIFLFCLSLFYSNWGPYARAQSAQAIRRPWTNTFIILPFTKSSQPTFVEWLVHEYVDTKQFFAEGMHNEFFILKHACMCVLHVGHAVHGPRAPSITN